MPEATTVILAQTPLEVPRLALYAALQAELASWCPSRPSACASIDMTGHPTSAAQTSIGGHLRHWDDLAIGLPQALSRAEVLFVVGLEQLWVQSPHRLAAYLDARLRRQVVIVISPIAPRLKDLQLRDGTLRLDTSLLEVRDTPSALAKLKELALAETSQRREFAPLAADLATSTAAGVKAEAV